MSFFGFGRKSYTKDDLDREVAKLRDLYVQAMSSRSSQLKEQLASQLYEVLEVCSKGGFSGMEMVEWPTRGNYTSLRNVTPPVQVLIEMM
jgi:hypothetical protein